MKSFTLSSSSCFSEAIKESNKSFIVLTTFEILEKSGISHSVIFLTSILLYFPPFNEFKTSPKILHFV